MSMSQHETYPGIWELAEGPKPELLRDYLLWLQNNPDSLRSAVEAMQWLPVGFNALAIARRVNPTTGIVDETLQLNLYHQDYRGNDHPHGHSRNARTIWYSQPDARQRITRHFPLPNGTARIDSLPVAERQVIANSIIDKKDGRRPDYNPIQLGTRLVLEQSVTLAAPLGSQDFGSLEVHNIGFVGEGVAISVHYKGLEEATELSDVVGLTSYKGLTPIQAEEVQAARSETAERLPASGIDGPRQGPVTMVYPPLDFDLQQMEPMPTRTEQVVAEKLLMGGLATAEALSRFAA